ncbi:MAG: hypothetical protein HKM93_02405 [Desulfobacteraceae bacterium]|nr:hypothetical protein [Desulfobacteraceae bacterium]
MSELPKVWRNGELIPWENATVPLLSHALSRGSAIFEVLGTHESPDGTVSFRMDRHLQRLAQSARLLGMEIKYSPAEIETGIKQAVLACGMGRGVVKIMAYWGNEAIIDLVLKDKLDVAIFPIPARDELGLDKTATATCCLSKWKKLHPAASPVEAKACANYLNGYLARKDAMDRGFDIGLMAGTDGFMAEGSIESVFLVKNGVLKTPPLGRILSSITRMSILELAEKEGMDVSTDPIRGDEIFEADEIFTCHTGIKFVPMHRFEDRTLEAPGPVTAKLQAAMDKVLEYADPRFSHWFQKVG